MNRRAVVARTAVTVALTAIAGYSFDGAFSTSSLFVPVLGSSALAALVSFGCTTLLGRRLWTALAASGLTALAFLQLAVLGRVNGFDLLRSLRDAGRHLLTTGLPADHDRLAAVLPALVTFVAATSAAELAQRQRGRMPAFVPASVLLVTGLLFGYSHGAPSTRVVAIWTLATLAGLAATTSQPMTRRRASGHARSERPLRQAVFVVLAVGLAVGTGTVAFERVSGPGTRRFSLRDVVSEPLRRSALANPLDELDLYFTRPPQSLFSLREPRGDGTGRVRVAVLDRYDGQDWSADLTFVPAGSQLDVRPTEGSLARTVRETLRFDAAYDSPYIPQPGTPVSVSMTGQDLFVNARTGEMITTARQARFGVSLASHVTTSRPTSRTRLAGDVEASQTNRLSLPLSATVSAILDAAVPKDLSPIDTANALAQFMRSSYHRADRGDAGVRDGYSLGTIQCILAKKNECNLTGSRGQLAAAFVLLARARGLPARLAVGFNVPRADVAGVHHVETTDATAWGEVKFDRFGWVPFDPLSPQESNAGHALPRGGANAGSSNPGRNGQTTTPSTPPPERRTRIPHTRPSQGRSAQWTLFTGLAVLAVAAPGVARAQRRRWRRRGTPRHRVVGAWREGLDRLRERGMTIAPASTVSDITCGADAWAGDDRMAPLHDIGGLVNQAVFSRLGSTGVDEAHAAWAALHELERSLRSDESIVARARHYVHAGTILRPSR